MRCERPSLLSQEGRRFWKYMMSRYLNQQVNRCVYVYMHPESIVLICYNALEAILPLLDHLRTFPALNLRVKLMQSGRWYGRGSRVSV